jgi:putative phosphoesterase
MMELMLLALISDIHSKFPALRAGLETIDGTGAERVLCCGGVVGYNSFPSECFNELRKRRIESVMGNHDYAALTDDTHGFTEHASAAIEWTRKNFETGKLASLRERIEDEGMLLTHGSPRNMFEYVYPDTPVAYLENLIEERKDYIILGHTHIPMVLHTGKGLFINPGSVGQPRDGDPRASFALLDTDEKKVEFHRVEYDIDKTAENNRRAELPEFLSGRLYRGI